MNVGERFIVPAVAEVVPDSRNAIWICLASHTKRKGMPSETTVLWGHNPYSNTYIVIDRKYVERLN